MQFNPNFAEIFLKKIIPDAEVSIAVFMYTGLLPFLRPWDSRGLPLSQRLRVAHLQDGERAGRAQLRQVSLQDGPGHQVLRPAPGGRDGQAGNGI